MGVVRAVYIKDLTYIAVHPEILKELSKNTYKDNLYKVFETRKLAKIANYPGTDREYADFLFTEMIYCSTYGVVTHDREWTDLLQEYYKQWGSSRSLKGIGFTVPQEVRAIQSWLQQSLISIISS